LKINATVDQSPPGCQQITFGGSNKAHSCAQELEVA